MSNPSLALRWLIAAACCWPSPAAILFGVFIANAFHRGWWIFKIDRTKAPRLNVGRNAR
jgi:hypothetical protein